MTARRALPVALAALLAVGCSGDAAAEAESAFRGYHTALLARDYAAACGVTAPEAAQRLLETVATQGISARTCEEAFTAIYAEPGAADYADEISRSLAVQRVDVSGDEATLAWTATIEGREKPGTSRLERVDGRWLLVVSA